MNLFDNFLRYVTGTVDFCAEGADSEGFLGFCIKNGIEIMNPRKTGYVFFGTVFARDYKKLRKPAKKFGLKIKIIKKNGIYFSARKNKNKIGFAAGMVFVVFIVFLLNQFIWEINVSGNSKVNTDDILASAEKYGLFPGTFSGKHKTDTMEWFILNENEGLASVEINIQGSKVNIIVNEALEKPEMVQDDDIPVNIIASRYGVIERMDVFDGQKIAKTGDAVMKGDLLVSAVFEDRHKKLTLKHARAKVIARTDYILDVEFPLEQKLTEKGKLRKNIYDLEILGINFSFGTKEKYKDCIIETEEKQLMFFWIKLPFKLITTRFYSVKEKDITYNFEQAKDGAYALLSEKEKTEMKDMEIISRKVTEKVKNNKYILKAEYICLMDIAEEQPIESDTPWENTDDMS